MTFQNKLIIVGVIAIVVVGVKFGLSKDKAVARVETAKTTTSTPYIKGSFIKPPLVELRKTLTSLQYQVTSGRYLL